MTLFKKITLSLIKIIVSSVVVLLAVFMLLGLVLDVIDDPTASVLSLAIVVAAIGFVTLVAWCATEFDR